MYICIYEIYIRLHIYIINIFLLTLFAYIGLVAGGRIPSLIF